MTTIATDGRMVAADSRSTCGNLVVQRAAVKLRRLADGRVLGTAGTAAQGIEFGDWLDAGADPAERPDFDDLEAIVLDYDCHVWACGNSGKLTLRDAPHAIGTGGDVALGAMLAGRDAFEAVKLACTVDVWSAEPVCYMAPIGQ